MTPRLVHPVKIELTLIDPANTPAVDPQFREPVSTPNKVAGLRTLFK